MITKIAIFKGKKVRKIIYKNEWWFSVVDVCEILTDSIDAGAYWRKLKQRLREEGSEVVTFCHGLKLEASLGEAATTEIAKTKNPQGFIKNREAAQKGGSVAGKARKDLEMKTGKKVSNRKNYLKESQKRKQLE